MSAKEEEKTPMYPPGFEPSESDAAAAMKKDEENVKHETGIEKESTKSDDQKTPTPNPELEEKKNENSINQAQESPTKKPENDGNQETDETMKDIEEVDDNDTETVVVTIPAKNAVEKLSVAEDRDDDDGSHEKVESVDAKTDDRRKLPTVTVRSKIAVFEKQENLKPVDDKPRQTAQLMDDDFLDRIGDKIVKQPGIGKVSPGPAPLIEDDFLNEIGSSNIQGKSKFEVVGDNFLDEIEPTKAKNSDAGHGQVTVVEDDFLDRVGSSKVQQKSKPVDAKVKVAGDKPPSAKDQEKVEMVDDEDFLDHVDTSCPATKVEENVEEKHLSGCEAEFAQLKKLVATIQVDESTKAAANEQHPTQPSACAIKNPANYQSEKNVSTPRIQIADKKEVGESVQIDFEKPTTFLLSSTVFDQPKGNVVATAEKEDENDATKNGQFSTPFSCANVVLNDTVENVVENNDIENKNVQQQKEKEESKLVEAPPRSENQHQQLPPADPHHEEEDLDATLPLENIEDGELPSDALPTNEQELIKAAAAAARETAIKDEAFNAAFDEFCVTFLETDPSNVNEKEIKSFAEKIPVDFVVSEERFPPLFKVLFKIKEAPNKAITDETLALLKKLFKNLNYNKFLLGFWSDDREGDGQLGYSYTENRAIFDFTGIFPRDYNDATKVNAKVGDVAWSLLLSPEATVTALLEACVNNKMMADFYHTVIRKFKCLGEYMLKAENEEIPMLLFVYRKLFADAESMKLHAALSTLIALCKSPKGEDQCCAVKPNTVIHELMTNLVRDDSKQSAYTTALRRFFTATPALDCVMEWKHDSTGYDNPSKFLISFIKYYNRKQSATAINDIFYIFDGFKTSLKQSGVELENVEEFETRAEIDWPFVYKVFKFLDVKNSKLPIPSSLYMILPEEEVENFVELPEIDPSIEKALIGIFEAFFVCGNLVEVSDVLYQDLWKTYQCTVPIVETLASAIIEAHANLKNSNNIELRDKFCEFISKLYHSYFTQDFVQSATIGFGMDCEFIISNSHLLVIGRALRLIVESQSEAEGKKPPFTSVTSLFSDLFAIMHTKNYDKFQQIRTDTEGTWPPWRSGPGAQMGDAKSMALNYILNEIQKEIYCVFDHIFAPSQSFIDILNHLARQRRYYGLFHPKIDELLRGRYPELFEPPSRRGPPRDGGDNGGGYGQSNYQPRCGSNDFQQPQQQQYAGGRGGGYSSGRGGYDGGGGRGQSDSNDSQQYQNDSGRGGYSSARGGGYQNDFQSNRGGGRGGGYGRGDYGNVNNDQREEEPLQYQSARGGFSSVRGGNGGGRGSYNNQQQDGYNDDRQQSYQNPRGGASSVGRGGYGRGGGGYNNEDNPDGYNNEPQQQQTNQNPRGCGSDRGGYGRGGGGRGGYGNQENQQQQYGEDNSQHQSNNARGGYSSSSRGSFGGYRGTNNGGGDDGNRQFDNTPTDSHQPDEERNQSRTSSSNRGNSGYNGYSGGNRGGYSENARGGGSYGGNRGNYSNNRGGGTDHNYNPSRQQGDDSQFRGSSPSNRGNSYGGYRGGSDASTSRGGGGRGGYQNNASQYPRPPSSQGYGQSRQDDNFEQQNDNNGGW